MNGITAGTFRVYRALIRAYEEAVTQHHARATEEISKCYRTLSGGCTPDVHVWGLRPVLLLRLAGVGVQRVKR